MSDLHSAISERILSAGHRVLKGVIPHQRLEGWKYTDLRRALGEVGLRSGSGVGRLRRTLPKGVELRTLESPLATWVEQKYGTVAPAEYLSDASLAFSEDSIALRVPAGLQVSEPIFIDWTGYGHVHGLIVLEQGAHVTLVDSITSLHFLNVGLDIIVGEGAVFNHVRESSHDIGAIGLAAVRVKADADAAYRAHFFTTGAKLSRTEVHVSLDGKGAAAHLSGVDVLGGAAHADVTTHVKHAVGNTRSTQLFKYVAAGKSRAVYQGKITVAEGANGSDSRQTAKGLLLEDRAEIDLKPELEIFADDVKCAHGAAIGDLDTESLFYLRARGIPEREARALLMRAFLEDAVAQIEREDIRGEIWNAVEAALAKANVA